MSLSLTLVSPNLFTFTHCPCEHTIFFTSLHIEISKSYPFAKGHPKFLAPHLSYGFLSISGFPSCQPWDYIICGEISFENSRIIPYIFIWISQILSVPWCNGQGSAGCSRPQLMSSMWYSRWPDCIRIACLRTSSVLNTTNLKTCCLPQNLSAWPFGSRDLPASEPRCYDYKHVFSWHLFITWL